MAEGGCGGQGLGGQTATAIFGLLFVRRERGIGFWRLLLLGVVEVSLGAIVRLPGQVLPLSRGAGAIQILAARFEFCGFEPLNEDFGGLRLWLKRAVDFGRHRLRLVAVGLLGAVVRLASGLWSGRRGQAGTEVLSAKFEFLPVEPQNL